MTARLCFFAIVSIAFAQASLTVYNQNFAVVRERRNLDLRAGETEYRLTGLTAHLDPASVVLRDLKQPGSIRILEQNYEGDPLNEGALLLRSEGKVLEFEVRDRDGETRRVRGKLLRAAYVPHRNAFSQYGQQYAMRQATLASSSGAGQPLVELDGKIHFGLPGRTIFDALAPAPSSTRLSCGGSGRRDPATMSSSPSRATSSTSSLGHPREHERLRLSLLLRTGHRDPAAVRRVPPLHAPAPHHPA